MPTDPRSSSEINHEIRERAFDLLNKMGGPDTEEDIKEWPMRPAEAKQAPMTYSSYQQETLDGYLVTGSIDAPPTSSSRKNNPSFSLTETFVNCVSGACKMAPSEVLSQQASIFRTGYDNLRTIILPEVEERLFTSRSKNYEEVSGTYRNVQIPQEYRSRYSDKIISHPDKQ